MKIINKLIGLYDGKKAQKEANKISVEGKPISKTLYGFVTEIKMANISKYELQSAERDFCKLENELKLN